MAEGLHRIPLPMPQDGLRAINVYVISGPDGVSLIDAGWNVPGNLEILRDGLRAIDVGLDEVTDAYVTHIHRDHYTMGPELRRRVGTRIHLGHDEWPGMEALRVLRSNVPTDSLDQLRRAGAPEIAEVARTDALAEPWDEAGWEAPDAWTDQGPVSVAGRAMTAQVTPGHTRGHLVFEDPAYGVTFTGDHVLPRITPSIGFELGGWDNPLGAYLGSLEEMLGRPDAEMLPAHGPTGGSVHDRVRELLHHHDQRLDATLERVRSTPGATGLEVARGLPWTRRERDFSALDGFNQMIATCETVAHLDVLVSRGMLRVDAESTPGVEHYMVS